MLSKMRILYRKLERGEIEKVRERLTIGMVALKHGSREAGSGVCGDRSLV